MGVLRDFTPQDQVCKCHTVQGLKMHLKMQNLFSWDLLEWQTTNISAGKPLHPCPNQSEGKGWSWSWQKLPRGSQESDTSGVEPALNLGARGLLTNTFSIAGMWWPQQHA